MSSSRINEILVTTKTDKVPNCPECGDANLVEDYDLGELTCRKCGLVQTEHTLNLGPEWRAFTQEERDERGRVGLPTSFSIHDKGLSTVIDPVNRDAFGRKLPVATRLAMLRLRKWQIRTRVHSSADHNLVRAMTELDRLRDVLHIPTSTKEHAALVYRKVLANTLVRGRSIAIVTAASLFAACRMSGTQRTLKDVSAASGIRKKDLAKCYRLLVKALDLHMPVVDPVRCVSKIATAVKISMPTQQHAIRIINAAKKRGLVAGKDPMGLAAASLYFSCKLEGEKKTQKQIAHVANVTEVTLRNRFKQLEEALVSNPNQRQFVK